MSASDDPSARQDRLSQPSEPAGLDGRRRTLLRGAAAATPVLATVISTPVHAVDPGGVCLNPSGFISQTTFSSRNPGSVTTCVTSGPTYLIGLPSNSRFFPSSLRNAKFVDIFGSVGSETAIGSNSKLIDVLSSGTSSALAKFCVAAYVNANGGAPGFPLTKEQAVAIWAHFRRGITASFIPSYWGETTHAIPWFQTLMPN